MAATLSCRVVQKDDLCPATTKLGAREEGRKKDVRTFSHTVIQCSTLCTQRKVAKFPCFWCLALGLNFNIFWNFFAHFFAMQLALVSMITVTLISSLSVFSLQRTRCFRTPESKGAPAESKGYTLRCSSDLLCGYLCGCRGEEEKPEFT